MRSRARGGALHALLLQASRQLCSGTSALEVSQANKAAACLSPPSQASSSRSPHASRQTPFGNSCCSACHVHADQRPYSGHSAAALHQRHQQQQPHVYHPSIPPGPSIRAAIREASESHPGWLSPRRQGTVMHCQSSEVQQDLGAHHQAPSTPEQGAAPQEEEEVRTPSRARNETETSCRAPADEQWRLKLKLGRSKTLDSLLSVVGAHHEQFSPQTACHALIKLAALHRKQQAQQKQQKEQQEQLQNISQQYQQGGGAGRRTSKGVKLLAARLEVSSPGDFTARDISNAAYAIAKLSKGPRWAFMALVLAAGDIPPSEFNARDLDQFLWALGVAGIRAPRLLEALEPRAVELAPHLESFQLSNVLRAVFSQLQHPAPALYTAALEAAPASIPNMHAEALANLLLALGDAPDVLSASAGQQRIPGGQASHHLPSWTVLELAERRALQLVQRTEPRRLSRRDLGRLLEGLSSVYTAAASGGKGCRAAERSTMVLQGAIDMLHNGHGQVPPADLKRIMAAIVSASSSLARC